MYNEERKLAYIKKKEDEVSLNKYYLTDLFTNTERFEVKYGKDVCDWTTKEIISYYKYYDTCSMNTLTVKHSSLRQYTDWCVSEMLVADCQNHFAEIDAGVLNSCINYSDLDKLVMSRDELRIWLGKMINPVDKFMMLGIFEGLKGSYSRDITRLRISDIEGNVVHLEDRDIAISDELKQYCMDAAYETEYYLYGASKKIIKLWSADPTIIYKQNIDARYEDDEHLDRSVACRYKRIAEAFGWPTKLTYKKLMSSGKIEFIKSLMLQKGIEDPETVLREYRDTINNQYRVDVGTSIPVFLMKYKKYLVV